MNENRHFVSKWWGHEEWIANSSLYCGKILFLKKDKRLSLHFHRLKTETFFCWDGKVCLTYYDDPKFDKEFQFWDEYLEPWKTPPPRQYGGLYQEMLGPGDSFYIPIGRRHTLFGLVDSNVIEFSTEHFDEDSIRILKGD